MRNKEDKKEYRKQLFKQPPFWFGVIILVLGAILRYNSLIGSLVSAVFFIVGFGLMVSSKYRILGRLEQKYQKK